MKNKKLLALLIGTLVLSGCGQKPTPEPTAEPTAEPTTQPTAEPTAEPTVEPTPVPSEPTVEPTPVPSEPEPTVEPTDPTVEPTDEPVDPSPSISVEPEVEHQDPFVKDIDPEAALRQYNSAFDLMVDDFSGETLNGTPTDAVHSQASRLRVLVDSANGDFPSSPDASIYKMATGTHAIQSYEGIGFRIRKVGEGTLDLENLVLGLRGDDAFKVFELPLADAVNPDGEPLEELTEEWQDLVIAPGLSIEDDTTEYEFAAGGNSGTKVLEKILGFHLFATGECSQVIEIEQVFLTNAGEKTALDSFTREAVNKTDDSCWWRDSTGFIINNNVMLKDGASYKTANIEGADTYQNIALKVMGDISGLSLAVVTADGVKAKVAFADLKDQNGNPIKNAVNGSFNPLVINFANSGIDVTGAVAFEISSETEAYLTQIFLTNLAEKQAVTIYPRLDTANAAVFDHFTRTQAKLDDNYESASTNTVVTDSGLNFSIAYHNNNLVSVDGDALVFSATAADDYIQVTEGSKTARTNEQYLVFSMKLEDGATLDNFRIQSSASGVKYANEWLAAPGLKSVPESLDSYPYVDADGYAYYIIDLEETGFEVTDLFDMYYTGEGKLYIDSIFFANEYTNVEESVTRGDAAEVVIGEDLGYVYQWGGEIANVGKMAMYVTGDGVMNLESFRLEYNGATKFANNDLKLYYADGTPVDFAAALPTEETMIIIDLAGSGYEISADKMPVHTHYGNWGVAGKLTISKFVAISENQVYEEVWGAGGEVTMNGGYQYMYGGYQSGNCGKLVLTMQGDGTSTLETFRVEIAGQGAMWANQTLKMYNVDGSVFDYTKPLPTEEVTIVIDLAESGFTLGAPEHMHFHFDGEGASGLVKVTSVKGVADVISYETIIGQYVEYVAPEAE